MQTSAITPEASQHRRPPRRGTAILPSLLTIANLGMGWYAIQQTTLALQSTSPAIELDVAAKAIGWAILLDGFDGRIARMFNASSLFGREFDSLADVISFGVAPALLAYVWGVRFVSAPAAVIHQLNLAAQVIVFLFVVAGAARLARFNIATVESKPSNPGREGRRYFVGMPIPAGAGMIAAVVHFFAGPMLTTITISSWLPSAAWLVVVLIVSYFMVSTWRFYSFKEINLRRRHPFVITVVIAALVAAIWNYSEVVLLLIAVLYTGTALFWRLRYYVRRRGAATAHAIQPQPSVH